MNIIFEFEISLSEKIVLRSESTMQDTFFCDDIEVDLLADQEYRLTWDCLQYLLRTFIYFLSSAVEKNLVLHSSIKHDLGYMLEEKYSGVSKLDFVMENFDETADWVGDRYMLFGTPGNFEPGLTTWLYNNEKGEIVLEITPSYRWHFQNPAPGEPYCTYEEFIKNYKPVLFRTIPKETALEWIWQAERLLKQVEAKGI